MVEVLTNKDVNRDIFIDKFTSMWRGKNGVSIRDLGSRRFLARFVSEQDLTRVTAADQPWTFKEDLVMVADRTHEGKDRWAPLSHGTFWLQLHNIPPLSMTGAIALTIGGIAGKVIKVDISVSKECIGRFLGVKVCLNVKEQLMRGTHVQFPDEGMIWVDFKYECLPNYCLICAFLGHPTRIYKTGMGCETKGGWDNDVLPFQNLDVVSDLRGNPLRSGYHNRSGSGEIKGGRGPKRQPQSGGSGSTKTGSVGKLSSTSENRQSGGYSASLGKAGDCKMVDEDTGGDVDTFDTASSPLKRRLNFGTRESDESLIERVRARKEREKSEREAREKAFDEGLIGPGGTVADGVENVVLLSLVEDELNSRNGRPVQREEIHPSEIEGLIDLNLVPMESGAICNKGTD